jgi:oligosaccharide repeat unit polymerase
MKEIHQIFPLIVIYLTGYFLRIVHGSWLAPGPFFALFWSIFATLPLVFAPEFSFPPLGLWILTAFVVAIGLGSILANVNLVTPRFLINKTHYSSKKMENILFSATIIFSLLAFIGVVQLLYFGINRYEIKLTIYNILLIASNLSVDRYNDVITYPWSVKGPLYFIFTAALAGGIMFGGPAKLKIKLISFLPIIISIIKGIIDTTRFTFLLTIVLWLSGYIGSRVLAHIHLNRIFDRKTLILFISAGALFIVIFTGFQWLRQAGGELFADLMLERMKIYFFGYLSAFTNWATQYSSNQITFGSFTFAGPANLMGLLQRESGFYGFITIKDMQYINIFTVFRGIVTDFTLPGAFLITTFIGFWMSIAYVRLLTGNLLFLAPLTLFYAFTMYSPIISIFLYNSIIMAWVIIFSIIFILVPNEFKLNE